MGDNLSGQVLGSQTGDEGLEPDGVSTSSESDVSSVGLAGVSCLTDSACLTGRVLGSMGAWSSGDDGLEVVGV